MAKLGHCKLTGTKGPFVKCHIIPKALTRPAIQGAPFIQMGEGGQPVRRWDSWYDSTIVTREGEDILRNLDTFAIEFLRARKLVWSSWGAMTALGALHHSVPNMPSGYRNIEVTAPLKLRAFFHSLLWRAAISKLKEFSEVVLPTIDIERLRDELLEKAEAHMPFYPVTLTQLSTIGEVHNMTPIRQSKWIPPIGGVIEHNVEIIRFYFDGLIAHVHLNETNKLVSGAGPMVVGSSDILHVTTIPYEKSFQQQNMEIIKRETLLLDT